MGNTWESYAYQYDVVDNCTAMTDTAGVHTYTYDAANRLTSVDGVTHTWDARGNLTLDGVFTYTYNAAGRMVRAESVTTTLVYTYNAAGLRVAQSVDGAVTSFAWDWATAVPEMLRQGDTLYLVGRETLGQWDGGAWQYHLPDALGSVRRAGDAIVVAGSIVDGQGCATIRTRRCDMATAEERMEILKMVQSGQISAEEGATLLNALKEEAEPRPGSEPVARTQQPRRLRIRVSDLETGRNKVNIDLPWNLINVGMHMGARFTPEGIDLEEVMQALQAGTEGKIVDVEDAEDNERVEIFVE